MSTIGGGLAKAGGALAAGAGKIGGAIAAADPVTKGALISTGGQMLAGAMQPEPESAYDQQRGQVQAMQDMNNVGSDADLYGGATQAQALQPQGMFADAGPQSFQAPQSGYMAVGQQPSGAMTSQTQSRAGGGLIGRYNPNTRRWEQ